VKSENDGATKSCTGIPAVADDMKSRQISAGIVPPNTSGTPSTPISGLVYCGHPTHTHAASWGT
jgi:hypothetical protein